LFKIENTAKVEVLPSPIPLGPPQLTDIHAPGLQSYKNSINIDKVHQYAISQ
jgi:hypothetical protein